jgi:hypothetical protein
MAAADSYFAKSRGGRHPTDGKPTMSRLADFQIPGLLPGKIGKVTRFTATGPWTPDPRCVFAMAIASAGGQAGRATPLGGAGGIVGGFGGGRQIFMVWTADLISTPLTVTIGAGGQTVGAAGGNTILDGIGWAKGATSSQQTAGGLMPAGNGGSSSIGGPVSYVASDGTLGTLKGDYSVGDGTGGAAVNGTSAGALTGGNATPATLRFSGGPAGGACSNSSGSGASSAKGGDAADGVAPGGGGGAAGDAYSAGGTQTAGAFGKGARGEMDIIEFFL